MLSTTSTTGALRLDGACGETALGAVLVETFPLDPAATFAARPLAPSWSGTLCLEVALDANAPVAAAAAPHQQLCVQGDKHHERQEAQSNR